MPDQFLISALGAVIRIDLSRRGISFQERAFAAWNDALVHGGHTPHATVRDRDGVCDDLALAMLSDDVTLEALAQRRRDGLWLMRAAGVADKRGHVVVFCGASEDAQAIVVRHLSQRYAYVSDDTIGIDIEGGVLPYRRPLSFVGPGFSSQQRMPSSETSQELPSNLRLSKIIVLEQDERGTEPAEIEELDVPSALELLVPQSSYLTDMRAPLRTIESLLKATGGAARVRHGDLETIDGVFDDLIRHEPPARPLRIRQGPAHPPRPAEPDGVDLYFRGAAVDALTLDEESIAILQQTSTGGKLHVLDGMKAALWTAAPVENTRSALGDAAFDAQGVADGVDRDRLMGEALNNMLQEGLLSRTPTWTIRDDVAWTTSSEQSTVLNLASASAQPLALEGSSHVIWTLLADQFSMSQEQLVAECALQFGIDSSLIAEDTIALLHALWSVGVVRQT